MVREERETIGIFGASSGVGATHFAILLANYVTGVRRKRTAVLEWNRHGDFRRFGRSCLGREPAAGRFRVLGTDYFPEAGEKELIQCMEDPYDTVIFDYGCAEEGRQTGLIRCRRKLVIGSFSEWQADAYLRLLRERKKANEGWHYFAAFGSEQSRREAERRLNVSVWRVPYLPDAYVVTKKTISLFGRLWE